MLKPLLLLPVLLAAVSCTPRQADLHLADLRFGEMRPFETELVIEVRLENEDARPLEIQGASYRLYLNGVYVGKGMSDERITIPPFGSAVHAATLQLSHLALLPTIQRLLESDDFSYRIEGRLYRGGLFGELRAVESGRFDLSQPRQDPR